MSSVWQVLSTSVANRSRTSVKAPSRYSATRGISRDRNTATPSVTEYAPQRPRAITSPTRRGGSCASRTSTSAVVHRLPQSIHGSAASALLRRSVSGGACMPMSWPSYLTWCMPPSHTA